MMPNLPDTHAMPRAHIWVTRRGVKVDRMASAWLIRRFIDPDASFRFAPGNDYAPVANEVRFDMFPAEHTHEDGLCTFEVLCDRFGVTPPGIQALREIIHDLDMRESRHRRAEAPGIGRVLEAIAAAHAEDLDRIARASALFDDLLFLYARNEAEARDA